MWTRKRRVFVAGICAVGVVTLLVAIFTVGGRGAAQVGTHHPTKPTDLMAGNSVATHTHNHSVEESAVTGTSKADDAIKSVRDGVARILSQEAENRLSDFEAYQKEVQRTRERYEQLKGKPGVIWGRVTMGKEIRGPLQMRLRQGSQPGGPKLTVTKEGLFAFEPVDSGRYEIVVYETADSPGIRYEGLAMDKDKAMKELAIAPGGSTVNVRVVDETSNGLGGVLVTVGKSVGASGTMPSLYTYRRGVTDDHGRFVAEGLVDGGYTAVATFGGADAGSNFALAVGESKDIVLKVRLRGQQIRGFLRDVTGRGLANIPVMISGHELSKTAETIQTGEFVLSAIPDGEYQLRANGNVSYLGNAMKVRITDNKVEPSPIMLQMWPRSSAGSIQGKAQVPLNSQSINRLGVIITKEDGSVLAVTAVSHEDRSFVVKDLIPGRLTVALWEQSGVDGRASKCVKSTIVEVGEQAKIEGITLVPMNN